MAKAIVRINAFLDKKQTKEMYNLIYDQVKAGLEVIIVPACCDVYVLDGEDIEVKKEEKNDGETNYEKLADSIHMHTLTNNDKTCATCAYYTHKNRCSNPDTCFGYSKWEEAKDNG